MKIQNKEKLVEEIIITMYEKTQFENKIALWEDGSWCWVGTGYGGEQDGNNPKVLYDIYPDLPEQYSEWTPETNSEYTDDLYSWIEEYIISELIDLMEE